MTKTMVKVSPLIKRIRVARKGATTAEATNSLESLLMSLFSLFNWLFPKVQGRICLHGTPMLEDGIVEVTRALLCRGCSPTYLVDDIDHVARLHAAVGSPLRVVAKSSLKGVLAYLRSEYVFCSHGLFGDNKPPRRQVIVDLWHGEAPGKAIARYEGAPGREATYFPVMSETGRAFRCTEFGLHPRQVPVLGAPRNDVMLRCRDGLELAALARAHNGEQVVLWMPTYRTAESRGTMRVDSEPTTIGVPFSRSELAALDDWLGTNRVRLVVKLHPLDVAAFPSGYTSIVAIGQAELDDAGATVYSACGQADVLITDVSSIWVDFLLVDKPIVFAFPDLESYRCRRGLTLEPYEVVVPGPIVRSIPELTDELSCITMGIDKYSDSRRSTRARLHRFRDDRSTARLLDYVGLGGSSVQPAQVPGVTNTSEDLANG